MPTRDSEQPLVITVPPDIERPLSEKAHRIGTTPELLALDSLREQFAPTNSGEPIADERTLSDFLRGHIGVLHSGEHVSGGARMSEDCGKQFTAGDRSLTLWGIIRGSDLTGRKM